LTYAGFYLGRANISVALPAIQSQFGWTRTEVGLIGSAFFWVYALGQLVNGWLGDRVSGRLFAAAGMLASVGLNIALGFSSELAAMVTVWAANGYVQSTGWGPILRVLSHWFPRERRARLSALFAPSFVTGHMASWLLSGWLVSRYTWRTAFWVPALLMAVCALVWTVAIRDHPPVVGMPSQSGPGGTGRRRLSLLGTAVHPRLRWVALACLFMGMAKDGLILWGPSFLIEAVGLQLGGAAATAILIPLFGLMGTFASGWLSARHFQSREAPVAVLMLIGLSIAIGCLGILAPVGKLGPVLVTLGLIGIAGYGANSILLTAVPLGLGDEGIVSSAADLLDFASYVGAGLSGVLAGWLVDRWGWPVVFGYWTLAALAGAAMLLLLMRVGSKRCRTAGD